MRNKKGDLPDTATQGLRLAGEQVGEKFLRGFMLYGVPIGSSEYVTHKLKEQVEVIRKDANKTRDVLAADRQSLWTGLRLSISQRLGYLIQMTPPTLMEPVAATMDDILWDILESVVGFPIPRGDEQGGLSLTVPVPGLNGRTFQEWIIRLPAKMYGWGFRSLEETCGPAYLGTLETVIPYMAARGNICPQLAESWGGEECWGTNAASADRWRRVLNSGCSEGQEVRRIWTKIQGEAQSSADWLGDDIPEVIATPIKGIGGESVSGETRGRIVEAVEKTRAKILTKALKEQPRTREALSWKQRDKVSAAWLLTIPGPDTSLTNAEFSEAAASNLCLPSPACAGRIGETVKGRITIDPYGDNLQSTPLPGDHWRRRHNNILQPHS